MKIYDLMAQKHTNNIMVALLSLGIDGYAKASQWEDLFDRGAAVDIFNRPMSEEQVADALWTDLRKQLESAWVDRLTREQALAIGNSIGVLTTGYIELCPDVKIFAADVPARWNNAHPDAPKIYRNDESLIP